MNKHIPLTLAATLRRVFDEGPYSRVEWAEMLDVSTAALSQWVNSRQVPTPRNLRWVYDTALESDGVPDEVRSDLVEVFRRPLHSVLASVKANMGHTLEDYVQRAETKEAMQMLMSLPAHDQRRIVAEVEAACREVLEGRKSA